MFTNEDIKFMAISCRIFAIKGKEGLFYIDNVKGDYCDLVHEYENGMKPASNGLISQTCDYLNHLDSAGMLIMLSPSIK